jgi:hypothetical protein
MLHYCFCIFIFFYTYSLPVPINGGVLSAEGGGVTTTIGSGVEGFFEHPKNRVDTIKKQTIRKRFAFAQLTKG